jgi:long-subunit fatty acid transport protein
MHSFTKAFLFFASFYFFVHSFGQGYYPMGGRSQSLANASATLEDVWAFHHNPAALTGVQKMEIGISYENRFLLKEMQSQGVAFALPVKRGVISAGGLRFGYRNFLSYKAGLGYSLKLSQFLSAGVQLNYLGVRLPENYGSKTTVTAELGLLAKITEKWNLGFSLFNLGRNKLSDYQEDRFSTVMRLGSSYTISNKVLITAEAEKNVDYAMRGKFGIEYNLIDNFFLRGGFASSPIEGSFGFGYRFEEQLKLDIGSSYHQILGWSPHCSFSFQF